MNVSRATRSLALARDDIAKNPFAFLRVCSYVVGPPSLALFARCALPTHLYDPRHVFRLRGPAGPRVRAAAAVLSRSGHLPRKVHRQFSRARGLLSLAPAIARSLAARGVGR